MDNYLLLLQAGQDGDWHDAGLAEAVRGTGRGRDARGVGLSWLADLGELADDRWRLLVWADVADGYDPAAPDLVLTPADVTRRRAGVHPRAPLHVEHVPGRVLDKQAVGPDVMGRIVLVTTDRANTSAGDCPGPWFPADEPGPGTVAARAVGHIEFTRPDREHVGLLTTAGPVERLQIGQGVIVLDES